MEKLLDALAITGALVVIAALYVIAVVARGMSRMEKARQQMGDEW